VTNSAFKRMGNTVIWLCNSSQPSDKEWYPYVQEIRRAVATCEANNDFLRFLVVTDGGGPNATQRSLSTENGLVKNTRTAVVTGSLFARGIATAYSWYDVRMKAFSPTDVRRAFTFLDIGSAVVTPLWTEALRLVHDIDGGVQTFAVASELLFGTSGPRPLAAPPP
jgi:hypothetical protein